MKNETIKCQRKVEVNIIRMSIYSYAKMIKVDETDNRKI